MAYLKNFRRSGVRDNGVFCFYEKKRVSRADLPFVGLLYRLLALRDNELMLSCIWGSTRDPTMSKRG